MNKKIKSKEKKRHVASIVLTITEMVDDDDSNNGSNNHRDVRKETMTIGDKERVVRPSVEAVVLELAALIGRQCEFSRVRPSSTCCPAVDYEREIVWHVSDGYFGFDYVCWRTMLSLEILLFLHWSPNNPSLDD